MRLQRSSAPRAGSTTWTAACSTSASTGRSETRRSYDGWGRLAEVHHPAGARLRIGYGPVDRIESEQLDALGATRWSQAHAYDDAGRLAQTTRPVHSDTGAVVGARFERFEWDLADRLVRRVDDRGAELAVDYDALGRVSGVSDQLGNRVAHSFDARGRLVQIENTAAAADGSEDVSSAVLSYDARARLTGIISTATGHELVMSHDDRDRLVRLSRAGRELRFSHGLLGGTRTLEETDGGAVSRTTELVLDALGVARIVRDPVGGETEYTRDALGRVRVVRWPDGSETQRDYDARDRITRVRSADGSSVELVYDEAGMLEWMRATAGPTRVPVGDVHYRFDAMGRLVRAESADSVVERAFDSLGRPLRESTDGSSIVLAHDDATGESTITAGIGPSIRYATDAAGRTVAIDRLSSDGDPVRLADIVYSSDGRPAAVTRANGVTTTWTYDDAGRLIALAHQSPDGDEVLERSHHDVHGRRRVVQRVVTGTVITQLAEHDALGRLVSVRRTSALPLHAVSPSPHVQQAFAESVAAGFPADASMLGWSVSPMDSRTSSDAGAYASGPGHAYTLIEDAPTVSDPAGLRVEDATRTYVYDALGRIDRVAREDTATAVDFRYDALGRWVGPGTAPMAYLGDEPLVVGSSSGEPSALLHVPFSPAPLVEVTGDEARFELTDASGSLLATAAPAGSLVPAPLLGPFGETASGERTCFHGMRYLPAVGLYHTAPRLYDPRSGAFVAPDPMGAADSSFRWAYARHDPIHLTDSSGFLIPLLVAGAKWLGGALLTGGAVGGTVSAVSVAVTDDDADLLDLAVAFGLGYASFGLGGRAYSAIASKTLPLIQRSHRPLSTVVGRGVVAGGGSAAASSSFFAGTYTAYAVARAGGSIEDVITHGARAALAGGMTGMVGGALFGPIFEASLRAGALPVPWSQFHKYNLPWGWRAVGGHPLGAREPLRVGRRRRGRRLGVRLRGRGSPLRWRAVGRGAGQLRSRLPPGTRGRRVLHRGQPAHAAVLGDPSKRHRSVSRP